MSKHNTTGSALRRTCSHNTSWVCMNTYMLITLVSQLGFHDLLDLTARYDCCHFYRPAAKSNKYRHKCSVNTAQKE